MQFIDLSAQQKRIRPQIDAAVARVLDHGSYIMGPEVAELEAMLAEYAGVRHAIGCSSGTDALLLPLMALGVGPGDAVFTTPFTFFATAEVVALLGATPVFADIDPATFNLDPARLEEAVARVVSEGRLVPKVVIPVDLFGLPADYAAVMEIASRHGLTVLEDAAQGFGAGYRGKRAPGLAHVGATSFFPAKPLGCYGDGGAVFTDDDALAETVRSLLLHGKGKDKYNNVRIGVNARLDTLQAAILKVKLSVYPEEFRLRQEVAGRYAELFSGAGVAVPRVPAERESAWAQYTIRCENRELLQQGLSREGIPSMVYYVKPMHLLDAFSCLGYREGDFPHAEKTAATVLSLPFHPYLEAGDQERVAKAVRDAVGAR